MKQQQWFVASAHPLFFSAQSLVPGGQPSGLKLHTHVGQSHVPGSNPPVEKNDTKCCAVLAHSQKRLQYNFPGISCIM